LDDCAVQDKLKQTDIILDDEFHQLFEHPHSNFQIDIFLPTDLFAKVHVPNYIHVPSAIASFYRLEPHKISNHIQHLIWSKLHDTQYGAYETNPDAWSMYFNNHTDLHNQVSLSFPSDKWSNKYKLMKDVESLVDHNTCIRMISMTYSSGRSSFSRAEECHCILVL
jgi:hypothetical protein